MCNLASALVEEHAAVNESVLCYPAMFVFGDSLSDTGNGALTGNLLFKRTTNRPYGETVPGQPSGRFSDGLLLVDFLARQIGLPLPKPYLDRSADFRTGVNYAVSGSTAQDVEYLRSMLITPLTKYSLDSQINWHISLRTSKSSQRTPSANGYTNGIYVLEIGGNDYIAALGSLKKYSPAYITEELIPLVIAKIQSSTEALYTIGARNFLYVGITPLGCASSLLAMFPSGVKDNNGCLQDLNLLSYNHGLSLLNLIRQLRSTYKDANFVFFDYYGSYKHIIDNNLSFGISNTLDACCGAGPKFPYRFNELLFCNSLSSSLLSTLCPDPNIFINWDGIHFTHNFNSLVFDLAIKKGSYLDPSNAFANCNPSN
ncbi:hypothetical protein KP509_06G035000 [Ceratopteris richardii]|nr:hypothetical protein KP509_06G035000 [Ceratopteris richardii]